MVLVQRTTDPLTGESTIVLIPDENKARAGQHEQAFRFAARDEETQYAELVRSGMALTQEQLDREKEKLREQDLREKYAEAISCIFYALRNGEMNQSKLIEYWQKNQANYDTSNREVKQALKQLAGICWTVKKGVDNARIYRLIP